MKSVNREMSLSLVLPKFELIQRILTQEIRENYGVLMFIYINIDKSISCLGRHVKNKDGIVVCCQGISLMKVKRRESFRIIVLL